MDQEKKNPPGRPSKGINWDQVAGMFQIFCTASEVAAVLRTTENNLNAWCLKENLMTIGEFRRTYMDGYGKMSLRRAMFKTAIEGGPGNPTMQRHLAMHYLDQIPVARVLIKPSSESQPDEQGAIETGLELIDLGTPTLQENKRAIGDPDELEEFLQEPNG
jgi:hypothetical protein